MDQHTGNSASAAGPKKDKKSKKSKEEDGDAKKKFVSIPLVQRAAHLSCSCGVGPNSTTLIVRLSSS